MKSLSSMVAALSVLFLAPQLSSADSKLSPLLKAAQERFSPLPDKPVYKKDNPASEAKLKLGKMLYFDTRLSKSNVFSCNSCHNIATGGVDNNPFSTGHNWKVGGRNAPTVFNAALHIAQFWDGRSPDVEAQAQGPILNPIEMGATQELVMGRIKSIPQYVSLFKEAFPGQKEAVTYKNLADAIGAFERALLTPSRFDEFLKGNENALSGKEKAGLKMFMDKGCVSCHNGPVVGGGMYQKFGLVNEPDFLKDRGRVDVTKKEEDLHVFKVPSLRNIALTYPYFNDGSVWDLREAVKIMGWTQLGDRLTDPEVDSIVTFLNALTGKQPEVTIPALPPSTPATAKPDRM
ncbi:MAG: cytochrome-c peroxidase [Nitrospinae bacterium]|nr:cytochrome-c peroxidase [Nitrospinota bacterium]